MWSLTVQVFKAEESGNEPGGEERIAQLCGQERTAAKKSKANKALPSNINMCQGTGKNLGY